MPGVKESQRVSVCCGNLSLAPLPRRRLHQAIAVVQARRKHEHAHPSSSSSSSSALDPTCFSFDTQLFFCCSDRLCFCSSFWCKLRCYFYLWLPGAWIWFWIWIRRKHSSRKRRIKRRSRRRRRSWCYFFEVAVRIDWFIDWLKVKWNFGVWRRGVGKEGKRVIKYGVLRWGRISFLQPM